MSKKDIDENKNQVNQNAPKELVTADAAPVEETDANDILKEQVNK